MISISRGLDLVLRTERVCGKIFESTKNFFSFEDFCCFDLLLNIIIIASAAAVPSSNNDAFANSILVRSQIMVWKFSNASSLPWAISG